MSETNDISKIQAGDTVKVIHKAFNYEFRSNAIWSCPALSKLGISKDEIKNIYKDEIYYDSVSAGDKLLIIQLYCQGHPDGRRDEWPRSWWAVCKILTGKDTGKYGDFVLTSLELFDPDNNY